MNQATAQRRRKSAIFNGFIFIFFAFFVIAPATFMCGCGSSKPLTCGASTPWSLSPSSPAVGSSLVVNVSDFHATGDGTTDDTGAFTSALNELELHSGGTLLVPSGTYLVADLKVGSGIFIQGAATPLPVLAKRPSAASILSIVSDAAGGPLLHDISIDGIVLRGRSVEDGFSEHTHNLLIGGVARFSVHHAKFEAYQGDGLYLGTRLLSSDPVAHNSDVDISDNVFDGVNAQNRNGVSVIDCERCVIEQNAFVRTTRADMPGAIDLEPNQRDEIMRNVLVSNNTINGSGDAAILVQLRFKDFFQSPGHILIANNQIQTSAIGIFLLSEGAAAPGTPALDTLVLRNVESSVVRPMSLNGVKGVTISNNSFSLDGMDLTVGCGFGIFDVHFADNTFTATRGTSGGGIQLCGPLNNLVFSGNTFVDLSAARTHVSINFVTGSASAIAFTGNTFSSPSGQTLSAIGAADGVSFAPETNTWSGNVLQDGVQLGAFPHGDGFAASCR
jgi:hypothetical protein